MEEQKKSRLGLVGGQAVLEGVMMKSGNDVNLAVRGEDGKIVTSASTFTSIRKKYKICGIHDAEHEHPDQVHGNAGHRG